MSRCRFLALLGSAFILLGLTVLGLARQRHDDIDLFVAVALAQGAVYLFALWLVRPAGGSRRCLVVILGLAAAMRLLVLAAPPYLSSDVYRYVWDGRVIAAGINPYRYIPTDPHLAALRDAAIFPNINRNNYAHTIYPPAAETMFFAVTRFDDSVVAMKAAMVLCEAIAVVLLLRLLAAAGLPATRIIVYAWHPLPLWEFAGSGHVDAAIIVLIALALSSRGRLGGAIAGLALAGGTLVKFYPAVLLPALWRPLRRRSMWPLPAVFAATLALAYLPFLGVGWGVLGFLPHYLAEEGFTAGGGAGFYLWSAAKAVLPLGGVSDTAYMAGAAILMLGLAAGVAFERIADDDVALAAALLAAAFILLLSPHYPWYFAWLIVFACLVRSAALLWLTLASFLLYLVPVGSQLTWDRYRFAVESVLYVPFLVLAAHDFRRQRRPEQPPEQLKHGDSTS